MRTVGMWESLLLLYSQTFPFVIDPQHSLLLDANINHKSSLIQFVCYWPLLILHHFDDDLVTG